MLGELEEGFLESLLPKDTFLFGGEILALQGIVENEALVSRSPSDTPRVLVTTPLPLRALLQADALPPIARAIDSMYDNSPQPTRTESEKEFGRSFLAFLGNIQVLTDDPFAFPVEQWRALAPALTG